MLYTFMHSQFNYNFKIKTKTKNWGEIMNNYRVEKNITVHVCE